MTKIKKEYYNNNNPNIKFSRTKIGDRVRLLYINDSNTKLKAGDLGTIVDFSISKILGNNSLSMIMWINWDKGIQYALIDDVDRYEIINERTMSRSIKEQRKKDRTTKQ